MAEPQTRIDRNLYTIAWICGDTVDFRAARGMLDQEHLRIYPGSPDSRAGDLNGYIVGEMDGRNIVLTSIHCRDPDDPMRFQELAEDLIMYFPRILVSMMVTTGSGVPGNGRDIRLGDVVVSAPVGVYGGVANTSIMYGAEVLDVLPQHANAISRNAQKLAQNISNSHAAGHNMIPDYIAGIFMKSPEYKFPEVEDLLFASTYQHKGEYRSDCQQCDGGQAISRPARRFAIPAVHYGTVASGGQHVGHVMSREAIERYANPLAIQVGAVYMMDHVAPLVITGVADYADSHVNDHWRKYAAATAAACARNAVLHFDPMGCVTRAGAVRVY
ncbi:hypothetical protein BJX76DRAFT_363045 [Aspergillus varians]